MSLLSATVVAFCLTVFVRLGTWGECSNDMRNGYTGCVVRAYPLFDEAIYQSPLRACACNTFFYADAACLEHSSELVTATSTPFASEVLNSSVILKPTVSIFLGSCPADDQLLDTIGAHARQLAVLVVSNAVPGNWTAFNETLYQANLRTKSSNAKRRGRTVSRRLPASFGRLTGLQSLDTLSVRLSGTIPSSFSKLSSLRRIKLSYALHLSGTVPAFFGEMPGLVELKLGGNKFSGTIPASYGEITCTFFRMKRRM